MKPINKTKKNLVLSILSFFVMITDKIGSKFTSDECRKMLLFQVSQRP